MPSLPIADHAPLAFVPGNAPHSRDGLTAHLREGRLGPLYESRQFAQRAEGKRCGVRGDLTSGSLVKVRIVRDPAGTAARQTTSTIARASGSVA
jgi:hypothetical protein